MHRDARANATFYALKGPFIWLDLPSLSLLPFKPSPKQWQLSNPSCESFHGTLGRAWLLTWMVRPVTRSPHENALKGDGQVNPPASSKLQRRLLMHHILAVFLAAQGRDHQNTKERGKGVIHHPTGVEKSSLLEYIANVLDGNDTDHYDLDILNHTNEQDRSNNQNPTNSAHLYELRSNNNNIAVSVGVFGHEIRVTPSQGPRPRHLWVGQHPQSSARRALQEEYCNSDQ